MNARTIRKNLMRNRRTSFWGRRAFVTVRLPLTLFPPLPPPFPTPLDQNPTAQGWKEGYGCWYRRIPAAQLTAEERAAWNVGEAETIVERWRFGVVMCSTDPRKWAENIGRIADRHVLRSGLHSYDWWEGVHSLSIVGPDDVEQGEQHRSLAPELIDQYMARRLWEDKWVSGMEGATDQPVVDAFLSAANYAKTTYHRIAGEYVYLTYSVKWFYPRYKLRFATDLHHAFDVARQHGVSVRLMATPCNT